MIIVDDGPDTKVAPTEVSDELPAPVTASNYNNGQTSMGGAPPPAYYEATATYNTPLRYPYDIPAERPRFPPGENARRRFIRAFLVGIIVWFLIAILTESFVEAVRGGQWWRRKGGSGVTPIPAPSPKPSNPADKTPPSKDKDKEVEDVCLYGTDIIRLRQRRNAPYTASQLQDMQSLPSLFSTSGTDAASALAFGMDPPPFSAKFGFNVPLSASLASFYSIGNLSYGTFNVNVTSDDDLPQFDEGIKNIDDGEGDDKEPMALVEILVSYYTQEAVDKSKVCYFRDGSNVSGVSIITPNGTDTVQFEDLLRYDVTVHLPKRKHIFEPPLQLNRLRANYTLFKSTIGDLASDARFEEFEVKSVWEPISVDSLSASSVRLETSNGKITGKFEVEDSLELSTSNQPISATITLRNVNENRPTRLDMRTTNSPLEANLALLHSPSDISTHNFPVLNFGGGAFAITTSTSNAASSLLISTQPPSSMLTLSSRTSNAPAAVQLPSTFEGRFRLATTLLMPRVSIGDRAPADPRGEGRVREVVFERKIGKELVGSVRWAKEGDDADERSRERDSERNRGRVIEILEQRAPKGGSVEVVSSIMPVVLKL